MTWEDIGTEVPTGDSVVSSKLNSRPPIGVDQDPVSEPVRNQLLAGGCVSEIPEAGGELRLAAGLFDGSPQCGNVVFLHRTDLTRNLVRVNKISGFTSHKEVCTVLDMATKRRETAPRAPKAIRALPEIGPDGLTMPQRVQKLMLDRGIGQVELARMCSLVYAAYHPGVEDAVKQQHIFNIIHVGQRDAWCLGLIAEVFDVNFLWLQLGIGKKERAKN